MRNTTIPRFHPLESMLFVDFDLCRPLVLRLLISFPLLLNFLIQFHLNLFFLITPICPKNNCLSFIQFLFIVFIGFLLMFADANTSSFDFFSVQDIRMSRYPYEHISAASSLFPFLFKLSRFRQAQQTVASSTKQQTNEFLSTHSDHNITKLKL